MSITSSGSTSQVYRPSFKIYRDNKPNKCEDQDWDGGIGSYQPLLHHDDEPAPPPHIVVVQGPPNVGKSLMIKSLVKHYTEQHMIDDIQGPITIRTGLKRRRLQFVECPDDINGMIDAAKYADIVLLLVDASYGFEAETFEFLSLLRVHGLPKVMGVLTHLDHFKDEKELTETIQRLQGHFQTEICEGATTFHLTGLNDFELYKTLEVQKLAEAISMLRLRTPSWRAEHPYVLVDCFKDVTPPEKLHKDANCKRNISLYGYLRGCNLKSGDKVHLAGVGDFRLYGVRSTADPVPLSSEMETENDFFEPARMKKKRLKTGTYLRLEVHNVPFGMVKNFDPCHPILVGGISHEEENVGYMQARLKRHDWHMKLLKSDDPITVSAGWRRYQTIPIFAMHLDSKQHESSKYIPQYGHCLAMFWGPLAPPSTRIAVVQSNKEAFRITATAVVLDPKDHSKIVKECKLKGKPHKICGRRALIKFTPDTDVAQVIGASVRTWTEIQGKVKKATKEGGIVRCTFKRKIDVTDTVIMPVFRQVEARRIHYPLAALEPHDYIVPVNKDSLEKEDPAHRQLRLEQQRRGVKFPDADPRSYSFLKYLMLSYMTKNVRRKTVVVMSKEKRGALTLKRKREEREKERKKTERSPYRVTF